MARPSTSTIVARPTWLGCALVLFGTLGLGCVDLDRPPALAHPNSGAAGSHAGGTGAGTTGTGGTGPDSLATAGASGTGGIDATGGAAGGPAGGTTGGPAGGAGGGTTHDGGVGGDALASSSDWDASADDGDAAIDAPFDEDGPDAGAGGSDGETGTRPDAWPDSPTGGAGGKGGSSTADAATTGGTGGTITPDARPDRPDAAPDKLDSALPDTKPPDAPCALCEIGASLIHRYRFDGSGTAITDVVGTAHGTAVNTTLPNNGTLVLEGGTTNQHATLPEGILSKLTSATLEIWVTWKGGDDNQRILDFGSSGLDGSRTYAVTTVIISPNSAPGAAARLRAGYCSTNCGTDTSDDKFVDNDTTILSTDPRKQLVVVFDGPGDTMSLYLDGAPVGTVTEVPPLSQIDDVNNYLGKSQYSTDPGFNGIYHEFRIYDAPLTAAQVQTLHSAGTDAQFDR